MKRIVGALAVLGAVVGYGMVREEPAPAKAEAPKVEATKADPDANLTPSQRLALAKLTGATGADRAVTDAQEAARQNPQKDDTWVLLGRAWVRKARESGDPGFYVNADAAAEVVLSRAPEHKLALDVRGLVLLNAHKFEEARELASRIVERHPENPMAWGTLSDALLELGRYDEATEAAQKMIDLKPNLPSYSRGSHLQWMRGEVTRAKQTVRAAIDAGRDTKRDPEPGAWVIVQAASIFWNEGDLEGALAGADKAKERIPSFAPANVLAGRVALAQGDAHRAVDLFEKAYAASPLVETAWLLGDAREAAGDRPGAEKAWALVEKEGKRSDPRTLSLFYSTKNVHADESLALAEEEFGVRKDVVTEDALAWALYRKGRVAEAKEHIVHARRLGTPDPRLVYHEGAIRIAAGETVQGKKLVAKALEMNKGFDRTAAREAESLLAEKVASR